MNLSRAFILRPVATWLLMLAVLLCGVLGYALLPQAALPQVDYPSIQVSTRYPGASPGVMAAAVTAPLERQLGGMAGLVQMSSSSSAATSVINLRFDLDMRLDVAEQAVQAAINAAATFLPQGLPAPPIYSKINPADAPIVTLAVTSETLSLTALADLVETRLSQKLSQVTGVGLVGLSGGQRPAIRVQVDPAALAAKQLGFEHVRNAVFAANSTQAKGNLDGREQTYTVETNSELRAAREYRELVVAQRDAGIVRLGDVARVSEGAEDQNLAAWSNGQPAILLDVRRQPGANVLRVVDDIKSLLPELSSALPGAAKVEVLLDRTESIRASLEDTRRELGLAVILVVLVILLFLKKLSITLIPSLAVPLSLIGTFGVMYLAGFSINNLTAMALTIATGFVVDDAIVMIENVARYVEEGEAPLAAALRGSKQIGFTILSLTFSLLSVLIPLLFMGDVVGRLFREFAVTLAVAILISAIVSLTFTPMLCAQLFGSPAPRKLGRPGLLDRVIAWYATCLDRVLEHRRVALACVVATAVATVLFAVWIPKGFFPVQDTGVIAAITEAPEGVSFAVMSGRQRDLARLISSDPAVQHVASVVGIDGVNLTSNSGRLLVTLKRHEERHGVTASDVVERLKVASREVPGIALHPEPVQDLTVDDRVGKARYRYLVEGPDYPTLRRSLELLSVRLGALPELEGVVDDLGGGGLGVQVEVDRDRASRLGITMQAVDEALYDAFGRRYVSTIFTQTNQYRVVLEMDPALHGGVAALSALRVTSGRGAPVPLSTLARMTESWTPLVLHRERQMPAGVLAFDTAPGVSLGQAVRSVERARADMELPRGVETRFQGATQAFESALRNEVWLVLAAVVTMYIVLGVLYESFVHPLTVLSTLPSAGIGALLALMVTHTDLTVIAIIGIVLLIGIVQKNAIMIIDFALEATRVEGKSALLAVREACLLRFRPILMTTLAALLSAVPLALGSGPGSELRRPLGITLIGGLLLSQALTLFSTPVVYLAFDRLSRRGPSRAEELPDRPLGEVAP